MAAIGLVLLTALLISAIGFKKYVWFLSVGYGYSIAAIGIMLLIRFREFLDEGLLMACILLILIGIWGVQRADRRTADETKHEKQEVST